MLVTVFAGLTCFTGVIFTGLGAGGAGLKAGALILIGLERNLALAVVLTIDAVAAIVAISA
ncbi:putative membrane protein [Vibrio parahaemolyticus VPCR-2010]|nr:putative membrane protein [Vibrio parahaemolyticus VPCR-2010]